MPGWLTRLAMAALLAGWAGLAAGQVPLAADAGGRAAPDPLAAESPEAVRAAVAGMSDGEVRQLLLERLDAVAEARAAEDESVARGLVDLLRAGAGGFAEAAARALEGLPRIPAGFAEAGARFLEPRGVEGTLHLLAIGLLAVLAGFALERLTARLLAPLAGIPAAETEPVPTGPRATLALVARRLACELVELAAFMGGAWAVIRLAHPPEPMSYLVLWFFLKEPVLYARATAALSRFLLAPRQAHLRLVQASDAEARRLHVGAVSAAFLLGLNYYVLDFLGGHGVDLGKLRLGFWLNLGVTLWLVLALHRGRHALQSIVLGDRPEAELSEADLRAARAYPWFAIAAAAAAWVVGQAFVGLGLWHLLDGRLALTLAAIVAAPAADIAIRWAVRQFGPATQGAGPVAERARRAAARACVRIGRVAGLAVLALLLAELWGVTLDEIAAAGVGAQAAARLMGALGVAGAGYVAWEGVGLWVNRRLAAERGAIAPEEPEEPGGGEGGGPGGTRLSTVLPLAGWAARAAIFVLTALFALDTLGVDTTPLLAGAGIVGLAVGFGAQKLVADIVSGVFFLVDDAFRTGEYVEVEGTFGTVEAISLRSLRLRHHEGPVHTLPFGEIRKLTNYSRDWVIMKLRFTVPFDTDLQLVKKLFKRIGADMVASAPFADDFLQPFKLQGVQEVDDVGIVIRGKFMARPGRQWVLRKEIYARVQQAFEEAGIQFARREVRVRVEGPGEPGLDEGERRAIGAAAAEATGLADAPKPAAEGGS